jgi:peptidylprolyl isomerase
MLRCGALVAAVLTLLAPIACGGGSSTDATESTGERPRTVAEIPNLPPPKKSASSSARAIAKRPEPKVKIPNGPPPKELQIGDLITGIGPPVKTGDEIGVRWVAYHYDTGEPFENSWQLTRDTVLGAGEVNDGWERGLPGMKVGGLRELIVPSDLTRFEDESLVYVVSLLWLK